MNTLTQVSSAREELLEMLLREGILHRSESQPVSSRDGTPARWMLNSLAITLSARGAALAGRLVLERLRGFDGCQLATYGLTAVPILQSAVMLSGGRYHGLLVRKERKPYGSQKWIEGAIDPDEPTILIDDSIASGVSMLEGIEKLEEAGMRVEGCVALVRFGWDGGCSMLAERGFHVEAVYDIFADFMARMEGESGPDYNPTKSFPDFRWSERRAPDGLHPAQLAREVMHEYLASGEVLRPPSRLDRTDYDSAGGAWVSLRSREDMYERYARDGFWHFPDERSWGPAEDLVRAAYRTALELPADAEPPKLLESSSIGVTLFSALERATVGALDNERYGIVVVSGERPEIMGGALPRMPGIRDAWQQFRHARYNNAELYAHEPYRIYRHDVRKYIEPGAVWPAGGAPVDEASADCGALAVGAREIVRGAASDAPLSGFRLPPNARMLFVTVFLDGQVRGCMGSEIGPETSNLERDLRELSQAAMADERFEPVAIDADSTIAVGVSVLSNELAMGDFSREEVRTKYRHGQQALAVDQRNRDGLLLPCVATWRCLDAEDFADEVLDKAGITRPPYNWRRYDCDTWLADEDGVAKMDGGFKLPDGPRPGLADFARLYADYLERNQRPDGSLYFGHYAFDNTLYQGIDAAHQAHAAWILARAGMRTQAEAALRIAIEQDCDDALRLSRDAFVLLAQCELGTGDPDLAARLWDAIDRHGRVRTWTPQTPPAQDEAGGEESFDPEDLQNYVPGHVLLALAAATRTGLVPGDDVKLQRAFRFYRHRFRYRRDFGQVSWMALAWSAWWRLRRDAEWAAFVFEIADWILEFQESGTGAFLNDHQPETPGYTTAVYQEAIAAAAVTAFGTGDSARARRYAAAFERGFDFLDRVTVQDRDSSVLPNGGYSVGGLRENRYSSHIRIDFVAHALAAILELDPDVLVTHSTGESAWPKRRSQDQS